jgi:precorrin-2/cobalt-factor-2 C20-methyltransferase
MSGILYGIGLGPGDPELITVKAVHALEKVDYVFAAVTDKDELELVLGIVRDHLHPDTPFSPMVIPRGSEGGEGEMLWEAHCERICDALRCGSGVALLTLGDPMTFSVFTRLQRMVRKQVPDVSVVVVPGITDYQAMAAGANVPLVIGEESISFFAGNNGEECLEGALLFSDSVVLMKARQKLPKVLMQIEKAGL